MSLIFQLIIFSGVHFLTLVAVHHRLVVLQGIRYSLPCGHLSPLPSFPPLHTPPGISGFMSATIMAPHLDASQHLLIKTLLMRGFEAKLIASEASCSVHAVQRIRLKFKRTGQLNAVHIRFYPHMVHGTSTYNPESATLESNNKAEMEGGCHLVIIAQLALLYMVASA